MYTLWAGDTASFPAARAQCGQALVGNLPTVICYPIGADRRIRPQRFSAALDKNKLAVIRTVGGKSSVVYVAAQPR